jgi:hypothetical protein
MIEDNRSALDVAQQLQAVVAALDKAKTALVAHHIEHHLTEAVGELPPEREAGATVRIGQISLTDLSAPPFTVTGRHRDKATSRPGVSPSVAFSGLHLRAER